MAAKFTFEINCTGRDGEQTTFQCDGEQDQIDKKKWHFRAYTPPPPEPMEWFDLTVEEINDTTVRQVMINNHTNPAYVAKGIPEELMSKVQKLLEKDVESSPTISETGADWRTPDATKMWDRLCKKDMATYDEETDTYRLNR